MMEANYDTGTAVLEKWRKEVLSGERPVLFPIGKGELARIEIGPSLVALFGGPPGVGKTAFTMQAVVDALRLTPALRAVVCNVETPAGVLLDRQLARLSGVDLTTIRYRRLGEQHMGRLETGFSTLVALADRLCFVRPPFSLSNVAATAGDFGATLILLDYVQRILPPGQHGDTRNSMNAAMSYLRECADSGVAVMVVSAVGRSKDKFGRNTYGTGLNLASFRESSELEFAADSAFILVPDSTHSADGITLRHLKDRHGEVRDIPFRFDRARQLFTPVESGPGQVMSANKGIEGER